MPGATWTQIKPSLNAAVIQTRAALSVNELPNGKTRMYVYEGNAGQNNSRLFRSDDVATGAPVFTDLTSNNVADTGWAWFGNCDPQCWYDLAVYSPPGYPDMVYVAGDYSYGESTANKRGVVLSTDAGVSGTDMTMDGTDPIHPNALHPDQHSIVTNPNNPVPVLRDWRRRVWSAPAARWLIARRGARAATCRRTGWPAASRCCPASRR